MNSIIRLGKAFEKANLAWMEDPVPWFRIIQPDLSTSGGILETKRIVDLAQEYGIPTAWTSPS